MQIHNGYEATELKNPVVTLGIFDGVHRGHQALLERLSLRSGELGGESVVITFNPHPRLVLDGKTEGLSFLSSMDEKKELLAKAGVDHLIILEFTESFSKISAPEFVKNILVGKIGTKHLIVGHDHHFGHHGDGNYDTVNSFAEKMGFVVEKVDGLKTDGSYISSSRIREALLKGSLDDANSWLGYNYSLKGLVVEGKKIGRKIGFPTANLKPCYRYKLIPCNGVYAVEVQVDEKRVPGMLSIGTNPTVNEDSVQRSVEVHIFNFKKKIYGKELEVIFRNRMRDELKFDNTDDLAIQIRLDMENAIRLLE
jgi:riboflavin kinase/FMN adenylyltransferase